MNIPDEWLRWGLGTVFSLGGILTGGNLWFLKRIIEKADRNHDAALSLGQAMQALSERVEQIGEKVEHVHELRTDVTLLKFHVFKDRPARRNGRPGQHLDDETEHS